MLVTSIDSLPPMTYAISEMKTMLVLIATNLVCAHFHLKSTGSHYLRTLNYYQILFTILKIYSLLQLKILKKTKIF